MKKKLFFKLFIFAVIGALVTVTSCKDYDDDISRIDTELGKVKTDLTSQLAALKTELNSAIDAKVKTVADDLAASKAKLTTLEGQLATLQASAATKAELDAVKTQIAAVKTEILEKTVSLADFNKFKADHEAELAVYVARITALEADAATKAELAAAKEVLEDQIAALSEDVADNYATKQALADAIAALELVDDALAGKITLLEENAATKAELAALQTEITTALAVLQDQLDAMGLRVEALETAYASLAAKHDADVLDLISKIADLKAELNPRITSIETLLEIADGESGVLNKITQDLADQLEKIGANTAATELLRTNMEQGFADQLALIEANAAAIETVADDLEAKYDLLVAADAALKEAVAANYDELDTKIGLNKADIDQLKADLLVINTTLEDFEARISALEKAIGIEIGKLAARVNSMITEISFDYEYDDWARTETLNFSTAPAKLSWTFGQGLSGAIQFVKDQRLLATESTLEVKISPANADLNEIGLDKIYLIRRDGNNEVNGFLKVLEAKRSTALRAAPSETGLWNITFQMPANADISNLSKLVEDNTGREYLFALAIENTVDEGENAETRYAISDFSIEISAGTVSPIYNDDDTPNLSFSVGNGTTKTSYANIKNRYLLSETGTTTPADQKWNGGSWNTTATPTVADPLDDRSGKPFFAVEVGKTFTVELDNADDVFAYYVELDKNWALESAPSEWNAWSAYSYGNTLTRVYAADEVAELKVESASAVGDIIGFRVKVVNYDGTLVDPDGKSFYVAVGPQSSSWNAVNTIVTAQNPNEVVPTSTQSAKVDVTLSAVSGANNFTWTTDAAQNAVTPAFHAYFLDASNNILFGTDGTGSVTANFANVKKVYTVATVNSWLQYTDNKVYNGTLTINNSLGNVLRSLNVTFKKVLPTGAPAGFSVKTNQIAEDGIYYSYLEPNVWTAPTATQGTMGLDQVFNFGTGLLTNYQTIFANSKTGTPTSVTVVGDGDLIVAKSFVNNTTQHATSVIYNYGLISTVSPTADYKVTILGFPTVYSNIYNSTYSWRWATRADLGLAANAALPYSTSIEYGATGTVNLAHIFGVSARDSKYNAFLNAPYLASLQVVSAKLVSNANNLDEYFVVTPDPLAGATTFTLTQKSGSTNPTADVASTLVLTAKDMYNNDVTISLPMTVTRR